MGSLAPAKAPLSKPKYLCSSRPTAQVWPSPVPCPQHSQIQGAKGERLVLTGCQTASHVSQRRVWASFSPGETEASHSHEASEGSADGTDSKEGGWLQKKVKPEKVGGWVTLLF